MNQTIEAVLDADHDVPFIDPQADRAEAVLSRSRHHVHHPNRNRR
jgi:hypothetical protein